MVKGYAPPRKLSPPVDRTHCCVTCRWHKSRPWLLRLPQFGLDDGPRCLHPAAGIAWADPVTGRGGTRDQPCHEVRFYNGKCGPEGQPWEAADA